MAHQNIRVMLVDDHALVRSAIRQAIAGPDLEVVAEAASAEDAIRLAPEVRPDVLLLATAEGIQEIRLGADQRRP